MRQTVLITGGTGTIGRRLTQLLKEEGYEVALLSRSSQPIPGVTVFHWNVEKGELAEEALASADHIIHLAGAGIADERWTDARKKLIMDSRTQSTRLLAEHLRRAPHTIKSFISASAIGYYGGDTGDRPLTETSSAGSDFMGQVVRAWEREADGIAALGIRTVKLRMGVVLTMEGGALPKLSQPIKLAAGAPLGSGQQYVSWIHIDDLCRLFLAALRDERWQGVYNAVSPEPVTNAFLTRQIAEVLDKPLILPNIPAFAIKLMFGEMAVAVLGSSYVLNKRIREETDFSYRYGSLNEALTAALT